MTDEWATTPEGEYVVDDHSDPYRQSRCRKGGFCKFDAIFQSEEIQKEICVKCGRRVFYKIKTGRVDNKRYLMEHAVEFAQRTGPTAKLFQEYYGHRKD